MVKISQVYVQQSKQKQKAFLDSITNLRGKTQKVPKQARLKIILPATVPSNFIPCSVVQLTQPEWNTATVILKWAEASLTPRKLGRYCSSGPQRKGPSGVLAESGHRQHTVLHDLLAPLFQAHSKCPPSTER